MKKDHETAETRDYIMDLKKIRSTVIHVIDEGNTRKMARAARLYPVKLNQLLMQRNIKHIDVLFPFMDLAMIEKHKKDLDLIDLDTKREDMDLLWRVVHRIDNEFEGLHLSV